MSQHYVPPAEVNFPAGREPTGPAKKNVVRILERDGQIVPLLVHPRLSENDPFIVASDWNQIERLHALKEMAWPTILIEDRWELDDL